MGRRMSPETGVASVGGDMVRREEGDWTEGGESGRGACTCFGGIFEAAAGSGGQSGSSSFVGTGDDETRLGEPSGTETVMSRGREAGTAGSESSSVAEPFGFSARDVWWVF
jgi:hypothetical protein